MTKTQAHAGGRATESGMSFQAAVGTWFAAHVMTGMPVGTRFGIVPDAVPVELQFETGDAVDDIVLRLSDGGSVYVQCKTRPNVARSSESPFGRAVAQLVRLFADARNRQVELDPARVAVVLAVAENAPRSLDDLECACRAFDAGGRWTEVIRSLAKKNRSAFDLFAEHVHREWRSITESAITNEILIEVARLFRVRRFGEDEASSDWREACRLIGAQLFGNEGAGPDATRTLLDAVRRLIRSGVPANRHGLVRALRAAGQIDTRAPGFEDDLEKLKAYSDEECRRLARHAVLPVRGGIPIARECLPGLVNAVSGGSILVTGEPGAGKTGVLVNLARILQERETPCIFLSVERLAAVATAADVSRELGLRHSLLEVLTEWPGAQPGVLIIDALDASRGGPSEFTFASLIDQALAKLGGRWAVVASIRTFDLLNGRRFRDSFSGRPPSAEYADPQFEAVRHFRIQRLSDSELAELGECSPELGGLVQNAPPKLKALLRNIFNLSLAADLIEGGARSDSILSLSTQSELIDRYEDERMPAAVLRRCAGATVKSMVEQRRLSIRQVSVPSDAVDRLLPTGVLVSAGDLVAFAHHVLFDHVAGRFYLEWDCPERLREQVSGDPAIGLLLGPALRFALERLWSSDTSNGRADSWRALVTICSATTADPVIASIALRTMVERVESIRDVHGLAALIRNGTDRETVGRLLSRIARFVGMHLRDHHPVAAGVACAWASIASVAASTRQRDLLDGVRVLLLTLHDRGDFADSDLGSSLGLAAREFLATIWALDVYVAPFATSGIRFVAKSFGSDRAASRALLQQILEEPRFSVHAHEEAPWLAEGVPYIIPHDPNFAASIYEALFSRVAPQEGTTWVGGVRSQLLPMTSNRKQDYEHARWHLQQAIGHFLESAPQGGTAAVIGAVRLEAPGDAAAHEPAIVEVEYSGRTVRVMDDLLSLEDWRTASSHGEPRESILESFVAFLKSCDERSYRTAVETALERVSGAAVWARLLGVAADRRGLVDDLLVPLAVEPRFAAIRGVARDAVAYLAAIYETLPANIRASFETTATATDLFPDEGATRWWRSLLARLLSLIPPGLIATMAMKELRADLEQEGRLRGNPAFITVSSSCVGGDVADDLLAAKGVDLERDPDRSIRARARELQRALAAADSIETPEQANELWASTRAVVDAIDAPGGSDANPETLRSSWGAVSNAVERIAKSKTYDPNVSGHPVLEDLIALVRRLSNSPFPEVRESEGDGGMSWGNWDVRVYAASSAMALVRKYARERPDLFNDVSTLIADPVPAVRLQIAQAINTLWDVARDQMWSLANSVAEHETDARVLGYFISGPLRRIAGAEADRAERVLSVILSRMDQARARKSGRDSYSDAAGSLVGWLYLRAAHQGAWSWIVRWASDPVSNDRLLSSLLFSIRDALFWGYRSEATEADPDLRARARVVLETIVQGAVAAMKASEPLLQDPKTVGSAREAMEALYGAGAHLLEQACDQLYFGSGAFERSQRHDEPGLRGPSEKRLFLAEYRAVLDLIGLNGGVRPVHHLVQLYAYVADAAPDTVFDLVSDVILGPAARDGYHLESLAADEFVALIRRFLADYRGIFEDPDRRSRLVSVLELFSSVGWPEALKLMYELPDLLR